jgi:hypothetical protein
MSCLKKAVGQFINTSEELPPLDDEGQLELVPEEVLEFREWKLRSRVIRESGVSQVVEREPADGAKPTEDKCGQAQDRAQL